MRQKPENTSVSNEAWEKFNDIADSNGVGTYQEDWFPWFEFFEYGYMAKWEE